MNQAYESDLVERCLRLEPKAQRAFYDYYKGRLMGLCRRYVSNPSEADDIFQEAFIKVFNQLHTLKNIDVLNAWIKRIVINTALNYIKANVKFKNNENTEGVEIADTADWDILSQITTEALLKIIQELPNGYRLVFNLYVIDGYSHAEIADMLNITESTSKSQLSRAKNYLKNQFTQLGILKYESY
jgi:RNA polymerase sigma factor (sigma-70 family)